MNLALARTPLSSASNAHTSGGSLSGGRGARARREAARLGSAFAQQTLDRPADDGKIMPRKPEPVDMRFWGRAFDATLTASLHFTEFQVIDFIARLVRNFS